MTDKPHSASETTILPKSFGAVQGTASYQYAKNIVQKLTEQKHIAYFAGGCVRDFVMGLTPSDYDVATTASPEEIQSIFGRRRTLAIGEAFGVICVHERVQGIAHQVEVATFRRDGSYSDGRRPDSIEFTTPEGDAARRDFTINGLFFDPLANEVIDYVAGLTDLRRGVLRAIGDPSLRFAEDRLRMLRAVRFAARFGFQIDPPTFAAIAKMATEIASTSPERIAAELRKMLAHASRPTSLTLMHELDLLAVLFPELDQLFQMRPHRQAAMDRVGLPPIDTFEACIASLIGSIDQHVDAKRSAKEWSGILQSRWRLSNEEANAIRFAVLHRESLMQADQLPWSTLQPILISPFAQTALSVAASWLIASQGHDKNLARCRDAMDWPPERLDPAPFIDGAMLMELGLPTGPAYARLIKSGRIAQLDGLIRNREEALAWLQSQL